MKETGVYMIKKTGAIWLVEDLEYYEEGFSSPEFTIVTAGIAGGYHNQEFRRCLVTSEQYDIFEYIGPF